MISLGTLNSINVRYAVGAFVTLVIIFVGKHKGYHNSLLNRIGKNAECLEVADFGNYSIRYRPTIDNTTECLLYREPSVYIDLLSRIVVGLPNQGSCLGNNCRNITKYEEQKREQGLDWPPFGFTMTGKARVQNFRAALLEVIENRIPGDIVELGVWRGGVMILAEAILRETRENRDVYLFDAFEAISAYKDSAGFLENTEAEVRQNFADLGLGGDNVRFVKGLFKDSVPEYKDADMQIAILRVDGNYYDSYQDAMYYMYDKVPVGGIVIFDDVMTHGAVMRFWKDFKKDQNLPEELVRIDLHSAWFRKVKRVDIDFSKFRPPQDVNKPTVLRPQVMNGPKALPPQQVSNAKAFPPQNGPPQKKI